MISLLCDFFAPVESLLVNKESTAEYDGHKYKISKPSLSERKNKKYKVEVHRSDGRKRTVHWGHSEHDDYLVHKDEKRRENFQKRFAGIKKKDGTPAKDDPFGASYYSTKYNW